MTDYRCSVVWSEADGEFVGLCAAFPSLSWLAPTPEVALRGIRLLVLHCVADMLQLGEGMQALVDSWGFEGRPSEEAVARVLQQWGE